jgi:hypothetical protein
MMHLSHVWMHRGNRCSIRLSYGGLLGETQPCKQGKFVLYPNGVCSALRLQRSGAACGRAGEVAQQAGEGCGVVGQEAEPTVAVGAQEAAYVAGVVVVIDDERFGGVGAAGTRAALAGEEAFVVGGAEPVAIGEVAVPFVFGAVARARRGFVAVVGMAGAIGAHTYR